jgi:hypothetical protein
MTKSLFEQYEEHRRWFSPGTIHIRKDDSLSILEIKILEVRSSDWSRRTIEAEITKVISFSTFIVGERIAISDYAFRHYFKLKEPSNV